MKKTIKKKENLRIFIFSTLLICLAKKLEESPTLYLILKHTYTDVYENHYLNLIAQL